MRRWVPSFASALKMSVESEVLKCVTILNVLLLVLGSVEFGQNQNPSPAVQKNSEELGIQGYGRNDRSCLDWGMQLLPRDTRECRESPYKASEAASISLPR
jgi:hypothetical protein